MLPGNGDSLAREESRGLTEGQSDDVGIAAFDGGHEGTARSLDRIAAGLVERFAGGDVSGDLGIAGVAHVDGADDRRAFTAAGLGVDDRDTRDDLVGATAEGAKHRLGIRRVAGFAEHRPIEDHNGVGTDGES